jgi:hypothetical protein
MSLGPEVCKPRVVGRMTTFDSNFGSRFHMDGGHFVVTVYQKAKKYKWEIDYT